MANTYYTIQVARDTGVETQSEVANNATSGVPLISQGTGTAATYGTCVVSGGGTGQVSLTNHGVLIGAGTNAITQLAAGSSGQMLQSGGASADPAYSTTTYPSTNAVSTLLYASSANVMAALATANSGVLTTDGSGVPSWTTGSTAWTPGVSFGGGTTGITYTTQTGEYVRHGNIIFYSFTMVLSSKGSSTGNASLTGLPVSAGGTQCWNVIAYPILSSLPASTSNVVMGPSGTTASLFGASTAAGGLTNLTNSHFGNTSQLNGFGFYFTS